MNKVMRGLLLILTLSLSAKAAVSTVHKDFNAGTITSLEVRSVSGDIAVVPGAKDIISADMTYDADNCDVTAEMRGTTVYFEATGKKKWHWFSFSAKKDPCAKFEIKAPAGLELKAVSVSGDLAAERKSAPVSVKTVSGDANISGANGLEAVTVSGDLKFSDAAGKIRLKTTSGDIAGGIRSSDDIEADTVSGDIKLELLKTPEKGTVGLNTVSGKATLVFPKGAKASAALHSVSGGQKNNIINDPASGLKINVKTTSGDIVIDSK
jgi:DUF4097 and DUF4098 domain-containing protein YvlB